MTILSDGSIKKQIKHGRVQIEPYDEQLVQPASIDLRLDNSFLIFDPHKIESIEPFEHQDLMRATTLEPGEPFIIGPGEFVLGSTYERIVLPDDIVGRVEGKSSLGRLGLLVHSTAGFIDPGFRGHITLELMNGFQRPIRLWYGMKIGQMSLTWLDEPAEKPYGHSALGSKYSDQRGPTASRYYLNPRPEGFDDNSV